MWFEIAYLIIPGHFSDGHSIQSLFDHGIDSAYVHPGFSEKDFSADVAVVRLRRAVAKFTDRVRPICLPFGYATAGWVD